MKIETKFNIGDKVKFTKDEGLLEAEVIAVETLNKSDVSFITYVVMTKDGRFFRRYEYELNDLTSQQYRNEQIIRRMVLHELCSPRRMFGSRS